MIENVTIKHVYDEDSVFKIHQKNLEHRPEKAIAVVDSLFRGFLGHLFTKYAS